MAMNPATEAGRGAAARSCSRRPNSLTQTLAFDCLCLLASPCKKGTALRLHHKRAPLWFTGSDSRMKRRDFMAGVAAAILLAVTKGNAQVQAQRPRLLISNT